MIAFIGDVHQFFGDFSDLVASLPAGVTHIVQVGDLTVYPDALVPPNMWWQPLARPVAFIDGNHHFFPDSRGLTRPGEIRPGLTFLPRRTILRLDGKRVGFQGGADSITDRQFRKIGVDWWPDEEAITGADLVAWRAVAPGSVDVLVTHTPPASVVAAMTHRLPHPSATVLEEIWAHLDYPELICGHMHAFFKTDRAEVLPMLGVTYR